MAETISRYMKRLQNAGRAPQRKKKKKKKSAGFGGPMTIPGPGGKVSRKHGTGLTRIEQPLKPLMKATKKIKPVEPIKTRKKRKRSGKVKI